MVAETFDLAALVMPTGSDKEDGLPHVPGLPRGGLQLDRGAAPAPCRDARRHPCAGGTIGTSRQERRPIDKALHSACVAVALAYYYDRLGEAETAASFLPPLRTCVDELEGAQDAYLTAYGQRVVRDLREFVADPDFERVAEGIRGPAPSLVWTAPASR